MIATLLTLAAMITFVLFPALVPAVVHLVHTLRNWQLARRPATAAA